ncbi:ATP-binding protein [Kitasatospora kazusensis]|uniref:ATP-binding protein n=1 Tax=Kitasatospora kazusensis TaxID=407974 RepID=A0ABP5KIA9_9ACTN
MPETPDRPLARGDERACWLPRHRKSAGAARRLLRSFLGELEGGERVLDTGELLVSELVANSVLHAHGTRGRLIQVRFELHLGRLRIEVHDADSVRPALRPDTCAEDESGRGLLLVRELAERWGCCPRAGGVGKCTWALIGATGDGGETAG